MMSDKTAYDKLVDWFDVKFGFDKTPLKPIPDFTLNPIYWLGAAVGSHVCSPGFDGYFHAALLRADTRRSIFINNVRHQFGSARAPNRDFSFVYGVRDDSTYLFAFGA